MKIDDIKLIKSDERGIIYDCGKSSFISRKKGSVSADHAHSDPETVYLVSGEIELTIGAETKIVKAPSKFTSLPDVYHKLVALTNIELVIDREGEVLVSLLQAIVSEAKELKGKHTLEMDASVNYACVFSQNEIEFEHFLALAKSLGKVVQDTPTGPLFRISPMRTSAGSLEIIKIRKPDPTRQERGDADFTVSNYETFKTEYVGREGWTCVKREGFEMMELIDPTFNVRAYFSNHPHTERL